MALFTPQQRQTALWTGIGILLVAILLLLGPILTPFIAGSILAYALNPIVDWLRAQRLGNFRIPRIIAVIIVMLLLFSLVTAFALIMIPMLIRELANALRTDSRIHRQGQQPLKPDSE